MMLLVLFSAECEFHILLLTAETRGVRLFEHARLFERIQYIKSASRVVPVVGQCIVHVMRVSSVFAHADVYLVLISHWLQCLSFV